jgi:DNA-binding CsgD family transcriptional regulator
MFGTEIKLSTCIVTVIELFILFFQFFNYLSRSYDKSRLRFLVLISLFIFYNLASGFLPDKNIPISIFIQNIIAFGSGILLACYYFFYLTKELNIIQERLFNSKILIYSLSISFVLGFVFTYLITSSINLSKQLFIIFPVLIAIYFCIKTVSFIIKRKKNNPIDNSPLKKMLFSGYIGIIFMASMPIVVFFGDYQIINNTLVNVSFFLAFYAYIIRHFYVSKKENILLKELEKNIRAKNLLNPFVDFDLTKKENEIASMILQKVTYKVIANEMNISEGTVSKHASNIFKKTNCQKKSFFLEKFKSTQNTDNKLTN